MIFKPTIGFIRDKRNAHKAVFSRLLSVCHDNIYLQGVCEEGLKITRADYINITGGFPSYCTFVLVVDVAVDVEVSGVMIGVLGVGNVPFPTISIKISVLRPNWSWPVTVSLFIPLKIIMVSLKLPCSLISIGLPFSVRLLTRNAKPLIVVVAVMTVEPSKGSVITI